MLSSSFDTVPPHRPIRCRPLLALIGTAAIALTAGLGSAPATAAPTDSGSSPAGSVRHDRGTASASCRDGAQTLWKLSVRWDGSYRSGDQTKVAISSLRWTTTRAGKTSVTVAATVTDGNGHRSGTTKRSARTSYRGGRTALRLNPVNPVADDAPARLSVTIGTRGAAGCRVRFTEPISKPRPKPTSTPTTKPTQTSSAATTYRNDVFADTNVQRSKQSLTRFGANACVARYAQAQADRMAAQNRMYHQELGPILDSCGLRTAGENVAWGYASGSDVVVGWMNSPGHRANILNPSFRLLGVGATQGPDGRWFSAQVFGG